MPPRARESGWLGLGSMLGAGQAGRRGRFVWCPQEGCLWLPHRAPSVRAAAQSTHASARHQGQQEGQPAYPNTRPRQPGRCHRCGCHYCHHWLWWQRHPSRSGSPAPARPSHCRRRCPAGPRSCPLHSRRAGCVFAACKKTCSEGSIIFHRGAALPCLPPPPTPVIWQSSPSTPALPLTPTPGAAVSLAGT